MQDLCAKDVAIFVAFTLPILRKSKTVDISPKEQKFSPFSENPTGTVGSLGEVALLKKIETWLSQTPAVSPATPRGIGDDCAVLPSSNERRLVTTDSVVFGKHFDESVPPQNAGAKLLNRNASDIAAMGGVPTDAVVALIMSSDVSTPWLENFYSGIAEACGKIGVELCGGDVASVHGTQIFCAALTMSGFAQKPLLRSGAKIGDKIFVTGTLGGSIKGKHFAFTPRIKEGQFLASLPEGKISSCIDVTDGILKDHRALVPTGAHAEFDLGKIPLSDDAKSLGGDALVHAFCDGEDYELLFCVAKDFAEELKQRWAEKFPTTLLTCIGEIAPGEKETLPKEISSGNGYEHFLR